MAIYGAHLGTAFQLVDDALDYSAKSEDIGKNIGDDLAEGKPTLPLIYAMKNGSDAQRQLLRQAITHADNHHIDKVLKIIESTQAITYTMLSAQKEVDKAISALQNLPDSPYTDALHTLAHFSIDRSY